MISGYYYDRDDLNTPGSLELDIIFIATPLLAARRPVMVYGGDES